jgi:predicted PurR-regulated permease PerM
MGEPRLYKIVGAFTLMGFVAFAFYASIGDITQSYNTSQNQSQAEELQQITESSRDFQQQTREIQNQSESTNFLTRSLDDLTGGIYTRAIGAFGSITDFIGGAAQTISTTIGLAFLPRGAQRLVGIILSLFVTVIVFVVLAKMYFRQRI